MSASAFGTDVHYTRRYRLGCRLGRLCRHLLLMTATPHNGKEEDFQLFMALLDGDRFEGRVRPGTPRPDIAGLMRRLTKEDLRTFDGRPLFPERRAYTVRYTLSAAESALYTAVTDYVRTEMNRAGHGTEAGGGKRGTVGFALQILQRRLASSPAAIHRSLQRRRQRLEADLARARRGGGPARPGITDVADDLFRNIDACDHADPDSLEEDSLVTAVTAAETADQLAQEVATLGALEARARALFISGQDTKWTQLDRILDDALMRNRDGTRRKLIIFTEPLDTLHYLLDKVRARLGRPDAADAIHGSVARAARRRIVGRFMNDPDLLVLIANDAAGEGVNLQRGHLMVNYDLPWNPNRIEQRFGRIHRIGQTEVCHLWNLVAADTREGAVYARLLEKLESARADLGGRVYDVLGQVFDETPLHDLLVQAIRYGEQEGVKARLTRAVDGAADRQHLLELLDRRQLTDDTLPPARVRELQRDMQQAAARRLQPHHVQSFFLEAFARLGGRIRPREPGRWEITRVPLCLHDHHIHGPAPLQRKYERICFEKHRVNRQPVAAFICPGHPLLDATVSLLCTRNDLLLRRGGILVDDTDPGHDITALFLLEHHVRNGSGHTLSERLAFASIDRHGTATDAGLAPHLNLRPATRREIAGIRDLVDADWLYTDLQETAARFATGDLAQSHLAQVRARRLPEIDRTEQAVRARLGREINHWDARAFELQEQVRTGRNTRLNWQNARRRAEELAGRLDRRLAALDRDRLITALPPRVRGGMVVIPRGLLDIRAPAPPATGSGDTPAPAGFAEDAAARHRIELAAMQAVLAAEHALGNSPEDVSARKCGWDITSHDPATGRDRYIEVKGRIATADTVMLTRQEIVTSLNVPDQFILALVPVENGFARTPHYVRGALDTREPPFNQTAIQFNLRELLGRAEVPR